MAVGAENMGRHFLFWILIIFVSKSLQAQSLEDRGALHESAAEAFYETHFFENGRGMTLSPDLGFFLRELRSDPDEGQDAFLTTRYGFVPGKNRKLMGVFDIQYKGIDMAVLGCTGCHSGRAAGITIPGLGNKTIDPYLIGRDALLIQKAWGWFIKDKIKEDPTYAYIHEKAIGFAEVLADKNITNLTRGLVPDSSIKTFFYRDQGQTWGPEIQRTQVKVPSLWGISEKIKVGIFADGALSSKNYGWAFGAELFASDSGEHLRASLPKLKDFVDNVIANLQPPAYPFPINEDLANKGRLIAENKCARCHGDHNRDPEGFAIFQAPELIPKEDVGTDEQRLNYTQREWVNYAENGSVADLIQFNPAFFNYGYFAPKLWGIWSRFPYLHNGSVPTLYHLLVPPEERPEIFNVFRAGEAERYDPVKMGLKLYEKPKAYKKALKKAKKGDRNIYYIKRPEHGNQGHYFSFMKNFSEDDRMAILEYLKTL